MKTHIVAKTLIDVTKSEQLKNQVIVIEDGKIAAITPLSSINSSEMNPDSTYEVNYVLPGLIDCHNHLAFDLGNYEDEVDSMRQHTTYLSLRVARNARKDLLCGVTTMRTCGEAEEIDFAYRRAINEWIVPGPRVLASGAPIGVTGGHWIPVTEQVDGPEAMRDAVRRRRRAGADFIKVMVSAGMADSDCIMAEMTLEELKAAVNEAKRWGKRTAAHIHGGQALDFAIEAGITSVEHGTFATEEQLVKMAKNGQYLVATNNNGKIYADEGDKYGIPLYNQEKCKAAVEASCKTMFKANQLGVKIAIGQDTNHGNFAGEMVFLVKYANLPVMDVLKSATVIGAETCGLERLTGTIEVGKFADIIGVDNNPIDDITALQKVCFVMKEGVPCLYNGKTFV